MNQIVTQAIILQRTDYGEADRILTLLTPDRGKLRLIAKGVKKPKSKLAGGIELFSVSSVTYIPGRKDIGTLISARLSRHYGRIVADLERTMLGYELIKQLDKTTEDEPEAEYFELLRQSFEALDDSAIDSGLIRLWFMMQLLRLAGHTPNLRTDTAGAALQAERSYGFSFDDMAFAAAASDDGQFGANHIKFLRLGFDGHSVMALAQVRGGQALVAALLPLVEVMARTYLRM